MESDISELFVFFKDYLEKVHEIKKEIEAIVKNLEQSGREIVTALQIIHYVYDKSKILSSCCQSRKIIEDNVKPEFRKLDELLNSDSPSHYYEYHENWKFICQRLTFAVALITYLEEGKLASYNEVAEGLGIQCDRKKGFHLDLEDYLIGLLQLPSELSRLAVNSVVCGDYNCPLQISQFVNKLVAGFQLLNFKNDTLRKRFDGLKYDMKKIEEVVYDLSIRGLVLKSGE